MKGDGKQTLQARKGYNRAVREQGMASKVSVN